MTENKLPESVFELIHGNQEGYELRYGYSLELVHGLMGYFPAIYRDTREEVVSFDKDLMAEIWKSLSRRRSKLRESLFMVNFQEGVCFPIISLETYFLKESKVMRFLTKDKLSEILASNPDAFQWAPGLVGNDMSAEEFRETLKVAMSKDK
jgi:hypothetical protein